MTLKVDSFTKLLFKYRKCNFLIVIFISSIIYIKSVINTNDITHGKKTKTFIKN